MATLTDSILVDSPLKQTWDRYFERSVWPSWVEGFASIESEAGYPEAGGRLIWRSTPSGRGTVSERVLEHSPRTLHRIEFSDPESSGELRTELAVEGAGSTRLTLTLDYALAMRGPLSWVTERVFVRRQVAASQRRTLVRFKHEAEELARMMEADGARG